MPTYYGFSDGRWTINNTHLEEVASGKAVLVINSGILYYARVQNKTRFARISVSKGPALDHVRKKEIFVSVAINSNRKKQIS